MKRGFYLLMVMSAILSSCSNNPKTTNKPMEQAAHNQNKNDASQKEGTVTYLSTSDFRNKIMDYVAHPNEWVYNGSRPAVIDFYATWCGPCKKMSPIVDELAKNYAGKIDFYKVDIDKEQELAQAFGIQSIPTFLFIPVKGNPTAQMGVMEKADFESIIKSTLQK